MSPVSHPDVKDAHNGDTPWFLDKEEEMRTKASSSVIAADIACYGYELGIVGGATERHAHAAKVAARLLGTPALNAEAANLREIGFSFGSESKRVQAAASSPSCSSSQFSMSNSTAGPLFTPASNASRSESKRAS